MNIKKKNVRTRFAPSPTGSLHVGGVRTALFNYLLAKKTNGSFVLRIEDTDEKRSLDSYAKEQYKDLVWLGIVPDESVFNKVGEYGPYQQKRRLEIYDKHLQILLERKRAYYCFCSNEELEIERNNYISKEGRLDYKYSRKCLSLSDEEISFNLLSKKRHLIRFFVEKEKNYTLKDLIRGEIDFKGSDIEDFIICRDNGFPLLNFAVVVDDHLMKISHVLRAEEHLPNTSKQLALYDAFGWSHPSFAHLSIILNTEKKKISKRDKEGKFQSVKILRKLGYLPQSILNYLMFLGWNPKSTQEFFTLKEAEKAFNIEGLNSRPPVFSVEKLNWFNNNWIRRISIRDYNDFSWTFLKKYYSLNDKQKKKSLSIARLYRDQLSSFSELPLLSKMFFKDLTRKVDEMPVELKNLLNKFSKELFNLKKWSSDSVKEVLSSNIKFIDKSNKKSFLLTFRKIITGLEKGPELPKVINLIGKKEIKKRLKKSL